MLKGTGQIYMWGWSADYPESGEFSVFTLRPELQGRGAGENASNYRNKAFDALFRRMKDMRDSDARLAIIEEMVAIARRDAPWVWGFNPIRFELHHDWLRNVKPSRIVDNTLKYRASMSPCETSSEGAGIHRGVARGLAAVYHADAGCVGIRRLPPARAGTAL